MLRAFAVYFQLANLAEQHHRLRRRREDAHDGRISRESLDAAFAELADLPADELAARGERDVDPARADRASDGDDAAQRAARAHPDPGAARPCSTTRASRPRSSAQAEERIAEEVTLLWQTDEVRHDRLRISDEIRHALWFFEHSLIDAATELLRAWRERLPGAPPPLAFGTWVGGDMDGNPSAGPASIDEALDRARDARARPLPRRGARARGRDRRCALAGRRLRPSSTRRSRETSASCPQYAAEIGARNELEPYRRKLSFMWWRLGNDGYRDRRRAARRPRR